jgi:hypothetical protein
VVLSELRDRPLRPPMSLTSSSWRRVASTHSLSDLLLDDAATGTVSGCPAGAVRPTGAASQPENTTVANANFLTVRLLGVALVLFGTCGLVVSLFVGYSCFPSNLKRINDPIQCSGSLLAAWHRVYVVFGLHSIIVPALNVVGRLWVTTTGVSLPLVDKAIQLIESEYPADKDAFFHAVESRGENPSEVVLYGIGIVPVLCGPVTFAMIATNWFSMKIFKHN